MLRGGTDRWICGLRTGRRASMTTDDVTSREGIAGAVRSLPASGPLERRSCSAKRALWKDSLLERGGLTLHSLSVSSASMKKEAFSLSRVAWSGALPPLRWIWIMRVNERDATGPRDKAATATIEMVWCRFIISTPKMILFGTFLMSSSIKLQAKIKKISSTSYLFIISREVYRTSYLPMYLLFYFKRHISKTDLKSFEPAI